MSQAIFLKERGMTMRLDKFLADVGIGSRKEIKQLLKKNRSNCLDGRNSYVSEILLLHVA